MLRNLIFLAVFYFLAHAVHAAEPVRDVVVYGGTSGGVVAAAQAARMGKSVVLIEPGRHLGGLSSGGLGATDIGNKQAIGGVSREFYQRIHRHYQNANAWKQETLDQFAERRGKQMVDQDTMWHFEPRVAEAVFREMLDEADVPVVFGERLDLKKGVTKDGAKITEIVMESGRVYPGRMFIDATYEGDLMAKAGVSYAVGREPSNQYGEKFNGVAKHADQYHQFIKPIDPYVTPGDPASGLLPGVRAEPPGDDGQGDRRVQAYCFRMCTTDVPENRLPWPKPEDYDPQRYELLLRNFEAGDHRVPWNPDSMPNRKTDTNNNFAISTDNIGMNYDYPDGDYATRQRILREHETYQKGLMWTLAHSPRVPEAVRARFQTWGPAKDEFIDNGNWPHQLYIREARRMVADYVMTENDCMGRTRAADSVGMGAYNMDSHHTQRYVDENGHARNEGDVQIRVSPYPISYRAIVPKAGQCDNLLVPVCLSASHIAYGSIRMEPVFMVLGQSAATAAAMALDANTPVQSLDYVQLRKRLLDDKQVLEYVDPRQFAGIDARTLSGVVVDNTDASRKGEWCDSASQGSFVGRGYMHDGNTAKGAKTATFRICPPRAGRYEVRISYAADENRATNVPVAVHAADGVHRIKVDQTVAPTIAKTFLSLGTFPFDAGQPAEVVISTEATKGYVVIDAVQLLPTPDNKASHRDGDRP